MLPRWRPGRARRRVAGMTQDADDDFDVWVRPQLLVMRRLAARLAPARRVIISGVSFRERGIRSADRCRATASSYGRS